MPACVDVLEGRLVLSSFPTSLGAAGQFAVLGLAEAGIDNNNASVTGDEGISQWGGMWLSRSSGIHGDVVEYAGGQYTSERAFGGDVKIDPDLMAQADADALRVSAEAAALAPTQTLEPVCRPTTVTGNGGLNVIDVPGGIFSTLVLKGFSRDVFIVNVPSVYIDGGGLELAGGVRADHVLYNITGSGYASLKGTVEGTVLVPNCPVTLQGRVEGQIVDGREITLGDRFNPMQGVDIKADPFQVPANLAGLSGGNGLRTSTPPNRGSANAPVPADLGAAARFTVLALPDTEVYLGVPLAKVKEEVGSAVVGDLGLSEGCDAYLVNYSHVFGSLFFGTRFSWFTQGGSGLRNGENDPGLLARADADARRFPPRLPLYPPRKRSSDPGAHDRHRKWWPQHHQHQRKH